MTSRRQPAKRGVPEHRALPAKEMGLFKSLLKFYELKQYKKGIKVSDQILKKHPNHGETLCMKGLFYANLDQKDKAVTCAKLGITKDITSHVCWHVFGLIHRADRNYTEAAKCYTQALKFDPNNFQILRDLAVLQTQLRQYDQLVQTRHALLQHQPGNSAYWLALVLAHHLTGKPKSALKVMATFEESIRTSVELGRSESSEVELYKNLLLEQAGEYAQALEHLDKAKTKICDVLGWRERRARLLLAVGRLNDAKVAYRDLIDWNPDHRGYLWQWLQSLEVLPKSLAPSELIRLQTGALAAEDDSGASPSSLTEALAHRIVETCHPLLEAYPTSVQLQLIPLKFTYGAEFRRHADALLQRMLQKGIPSLFAILKPLYRHQPSKIAVVQELVEAIAGAHAEAGTTSSDEPNGHPSTYAWCLYFLAQHYDYLGQTAKALELTEQALKLSSTAQQDLLVAQAKFLKHAGDIAGAAQVLNTARELDSRDRFVNSKCTKYMLRNDQVEEAENTIMMFVRKDVPDQKEELRELQVLWYELEAGDSFRRRRMWGPALKRYHLAKHDFDEFMDDQLDFHTYILRKLSFCSYIDMMRFEDQVYTLKPYIHAATAAVQCYVAIYDQRQRDLANGVAAPPAPPASKAKAATIADAADDDIDDSSSEADGKPKPKEDLDPLGDQLVQAADPLHEALKFLAPISKLASNHQEIALAYVDVYLRQAQFTRALDALVPLVAVHSVDNPLLHKALVTLKAKLQASTAVSDADRTAFNQSLATIAPQLASAASLSAYNDAFIAKYAYSVAHVVQAAETATIIDAVNTSAAYDALQQLLKPSETPLSLADLQQVALASNAVYATTESSNAHPPSFLASDHALARTFREYVERHYPQASLFNSFYAQH